MAYAVINKSGCTERKGNVQLRRECLKKCGLDGLILLAWEGLDMLVGELGQYLNLSGSETVERAQIALRYVSYELQHQGEDPITYQEFKHLVELADKQQSSS